MGRQLHLSIRAQLSLVVCLVVVASLGILAGATYATNRNVVINLRSHSLTNIAQLKSSQIVQSLGQMYEQLDLVASRGYTEGVLSSYMWSGSVPEDDINAQQFKNAITSIDDCVAGVLYTVQNDEVPLPVLTVDNPTALPNSSIPDVLFPAKFYNSTKLESMMNTHKTYLMGPHLVDDEFLISFTLDVEFGINYNGDSIQGLLTVVTTSKPVLQVIYDHSALGEQGEMAIIELTNNLTVSEADDLSSGNITDMFVYPTTLCENCYNVTFTSTSFSNAVLLNHTSGSVIDIEPSDLGPGSSSIGYSPAVFYNRNWGVLIYQSHQTVFIPLYELRDMLLISLFSIGAGMCIGTLLLTKWAVKPIIILQQATEQSTGNTRPRKRGLGGFLHWLGLLSNDTNSCKEKSLDYYDEKDGGSLNKEDGKELVGIHPSVTSGFRVPGHIEQKRFIKDELTELTDKFNEMTNELRKQYSVLEDRVEIRTKEIESARLIAENANQAKSLFIANITHELRTPLNGILGMTAVSMDETDSKKIKDSLKIIFKSGELLLHLLTDLLTFSKNQDIDNVDLEEHEFKVSEVVSQLVAIFGEQSKAAKINLTISTKSDDMKSLILYGDINRILQIIINLVSNGLKFTPNGGSVQVLIDLSWISCDENMDNCSEEKSLLPPPPFSSSVKSNTGSNSLTATNSGNENEVWKGSDTETSDNHEHSLKSRNPSSVDESIHKVNDFQGRFSDDASHEHDTSPSNYSSKQETLSSPLKCDGEKSSGGFSNGSSNGSVEQSLDYKNEEVVFEDQCVHLKVSVKDTGPGIAEHLQDKIFEAFVQGDLQLSERRGGAGLGLSICRHLAKLMNGSVEVQSQLGEGSTFTFKVPLRAVKESSKYLYSDLNAIPDWPEYELYNNGDTNSYSAIMNATNSARVTPGESSLLSTNDDNENKNFVHEYSDKLGDIPGIVQKEETMSNGSNPTTPSSTTSSIYPNKRPTIMRNPSNRSKEDERKVPSHIYVLIAEDNKVNQEVMVRMLRLEGIENVVIANDGLEAVSRIRESYINESTPYDLVFMDVQMPNLDGLQATLKLRSELEYSGPIVGVSAFTDTSNVKECLNVGMNHFLAKPLRRPQLHHLLLEIFYGEDHLREAIKA